MEFDTTECEFPGCHQTDFLATQCSSCRKRFCQAHAAYAAHACSARRSDPTVAVCPLCSVVVPVAAGESADLAVNRHIETRGACRRTSQFGSGVASFGPAGQPQRVEGRTFGSGAPSAHLRGAATPAPAPSSSSWFGFGAPSATPTPPPAAVRPAFASSCAKRGCSEVSAQPVRCDHCGAEFCLSHRTPEAHECAPFLAKQQRHRQMMTAQQAHSQRESAAGAMRMIPSTVRYANTPTTPFTVRPGRTPEPDDLLIAVFFDASVALPATAGARAGPVPAPFFLSIAASTVMGRLLDACCSLASPTVRNDNGDVNRPPSDMLHLYAAHLGKAVTMGTQASSWCRDPRTLRPSEIAAALVVLRGENPIPAALPGSLLAAASAGAAADARAAAQQQQAYPRSCHATAAVQSSSSAAATAYARMQPASGGAPHAGGHYYHPQYQQQQQQGQHCTMC